MKVKMKLAKWYFSVNDSVSALKGLWTITYISPALSYIQLSAVSQQECVKSCNVDFLLPERQVSYFQLSVVTPFSRLRQPVINLPFHKLRASSAREFIEICSLRLSRHFLGCLGWIALGKVLSCLNMKILQAPHPSEVHNTYLYITIH